MFLHYKSYLKVCLLKSESIKSKHLFSSHKQEKNDTWFYRTGLRLNIQFREEEEKNDLPRIFISVIIKIYIEIQVGELNSIIANLNIAKIGKKP